MKRIGVGGMAAALVLAMAVVGCQTTPTQQGAVAGGLLGAGAGAIIGNQVDGKSGEGALIGAGLGALTGALIGDKVDENRSRRTTQQQPTSTAQRGHWETRTVITQSGERYEERVWVPE